MKNFSVFQSSGFCAWSVRAFLFFMFFFFWLQKRTSGSVPRSTHAQSPELKKSYDQSLYHRLNRVKDPHHHRNSREKSARKERNDPPCENFPLEISDIGTAVSKCRDGFTCYRLFSSRLRFTRTASGIELSRCCRC